MFEGRPTASFDPVRYLASNPDLIRQGLPAARGALLRHWFEQGAAQHRPTDTFSASEYLKANSDLIVGNYGANPAALLDHWLNHGAFEGRASTGFNVLSYVASNQDLLGGGYGRNLAAAEAHWLQHGAFEGRSTTGFDAAAYLAINPDVANLVKGDLDGGLRHWIERGFSEGRKTNGNGIDTVKMQPGYRVSTGEGDDVIMASAAVDTAELIVGQGSSVGVGAALADPARDAPGAYFTAQLGALLQRLGLEPANFDNRSVNGSTMHEGAGLVAGTILPLGPDILFDAFGMNDGATAQFNSGQTLVGAEAALRARIATLQADGVAIVLSTTPHPHTLRTDFALPDGLPIIYPTYIANPGQADRDALLVNSTVDLAWKGGTVPAASRYLAVNEMIRRVANDTGALLVDAEKFWFDALLTHNQDEFYSNGEFVHPNLLGHQLSYHAAIDAMLGDFVEAFRQSAAGQSTTLSPLLDKLLIHGAIDGGNGFDTAIFDAGFLVDLERGYALSGNTAYTITGIEHVMIGTGNAVSTILGGASDDRLSVDMSRAMGSVRFDGAGGNDILIGGSASDTLNGGAGDDILIGGGGADFLTGGGGADRFVYRHAGAGDSGDVIADFEIGTDLVDVSAMLADAGNTAPVFFAGTHADRAAAQQALTLGGTALQSVFVAQDHALWFDVNHDGMLGDGDLWMKFAGLTTFDGNGIARGGIRSDYWV